MKMKILLSITLIAAMTTGARADPLPGFYDAGDGIFMGVGTGWGTEADILRDLGLDVFELDTLITIPPNTSQPLDAILTERWGGLWAYHDGTILPDLLIVGVDNAWAAYCLRSADREPCPVGTIDITGHWDTNDLGGQKQNHLAVFQARQPMNEVCEIPEPGRLGIAVLVCVIIFLLYRMAK
jgi:hypothetical protein